MKINRKKKNYAPIIIVAIILLAAGATALFFSLKNTSPNSSDKTAKDTTKTEQSSGNQLRDTENPEPKTDTNTGESVVPMNISSTSVTDGTLRIRALVEYITSTGECTLTMVGPSGNSYTDTVDISALPSSTTCKGFDIPVATLSPGDWAITIKFTSGNFTGTATKEITI